MSEPHEPAHYDPLVHVARPDRPDDEAQARARLGRAIRDVGHAAVGRHAPVTGLLEAAAAIEQVAAVLDAGTSRDRHEDEPRNGVWAAPPVDGEIMFSHDERPISGRASPWGLDLEVRREGHEVVASVTMRAAHEGAPGRSHGGLVAALFDDVFGFVLNIMSVPAFTGELTIRYEAGTPIGVPLECRARLARQEGRKLFMTGELTHAGTVLARTTATFITIDPERFLAGTA
ncbi:MAG: PaaI family thioesterase [Actinomycetota bacterium]|nr:PaaI family thioesterase [Actinomycetota bacterium]